MKIRDARIARASISGLSAREIAEAEKVSERQVFRILAKPEVKAVIDRAATELTRAAGLIVRNGAAGAARTLVGLAGGSAEAPAAVRLAAAGKVVDLALKAAELEDFERRLVEIEDRLKKGGT